MTLLQRAKDLTSSLEELNALDKRADHAQLFENRADTFEKPATSLRGLEESMKVLLELGIVVPGIEKETVIALKNRINDLHSRYLLNKNVMLDPFPGENIKYVLTNALSRLPDQSREALIRGWGEWCRRQLPHVDEEVLTLLEKIEALRKSAQSVRELKKEFDEVSSSMPIATESVERITHLAGDMNEVWLDLTGEGVPQPVLIFLRKAISIEGARLAELTQDVRDWMSEHGLSNSLRVRIG